MTSDDEHSELMVAWTSVHGLLDRMTSSLNWTDVQYLDVTEMADRGRGLASHLQGAVTLSRDFRYDSGFALLRTALEQVVVDWLVFLSRTYIQRFAHVDDTTWEEWKSDRANGADWTSTIVDWDRTKKGDVRIVRSGLDSEPDSGGKTRRLSIYYFLLGRYRPTMGPKSTQPQEALIDTAHLRRMADENEALWRVYLTWSSLLTNLQENVLVDETDAGRLAAHYRFLSGYAHPVADQISNTYGRSAFANWPVFDRYSGELVLLYAITLGILELEHFTASLALQGLESLVDKGEIQRTLQEARAVTSYFWFLGTNPHSYDLWKADDQAAFSALKEGAAPPRPGGLSPDEVPYPRDPLQRLVAMHGHAHELLTGFTYTSPWPCGHARAR